jgi:hypothetical protein
MKKLSWLLTLCALAIAESSNKIVRSKQNQIDQETLIMPQRCHKPRNIKKMSEYNLWLLEGFLDADDNKKIDKKDVPAAFGKSDDNLSRDLDRREFMESTTWTFTRMCREAA